MGQIRLSVGEKRGFNVGQIASAILAITMIAAFILVLGGIRLLRQPEQRSRGALMLVAALVLAANVVIWTV